MNGLPTKILLATDLSARSDRALDRAVLLARQWNAPLLMLHVLQRMTPNASSQIDPVPSWKRPPDELSVAKKRVLSDLADYADKATILVVEGDPVPTIAAIADRENCELIVIGVARNELLGEFNLGRTVDGLIRRSRVPLLIVKKRARRRYHHIVVATDFSESSRHALNAAIQFFPEEVLTVFHAYDAPLSGFAADAASYRREYRNVAMQDCDSFLRETPLLQTARHRPNVLAEYGVPNHLLHDYAVDNDADLVVIGTHGRSALFDVFTGSVAKRILDDVPCDILVIREPRGKVES